MQRKIRPFLILIGLAIAYSVLFFFRPDLDLTLHRHLYQDGFFLRQEWYIQFFYKLVPWITRSVVIGTLAALLQHRIEIVRDAIHRARANGFNPRPLRRL